MISKEDIEHLKDLSRVEFDEKETESLARDLGSILGYIDKLKEVDVLKVSDMVYVHELSNVERKDSNDAYSATSMNNQEVTNSLISAFPEKDKTLLKVKSIL